MTLEEKKAKLEELIPQWTKLGNAIDALRREINEEENPPETSEELVAEVESVLITKSEVIE